MQGYSEWDANTIQTLKAEALRNRSIAIQTLKAEALRNRSIASVYVGLYTTDALILIRTVIGYGYGRTTTEATGERMGVLR